MSQHDKLRDALVRLLWRSVEDDADCTCEEPDDTCAECEAWQALDLGTTWPGANAAEDVLGGAWWIGPPHEVKP